MTRYKGYDLVPDTTGKIVDSIWIREDKRELIVRFAWGKALHFKPLDEIE